MTSASVHTRFGPPSARDEQVIGVYCHTVRQGGLDSVQSAADDLGMDVRDAGAAAAFMVELGLLRTDPAGGGRLVPVDPRRASALLISPIEREIYARRDFIDQLRDRLDHMAGPRPRTAQLPVGSIDQLFGPAEIRGLLGHMAETCRREVLVLRSPHQDGDPLDDFLESCAPLTRRGVGVRALCAHRSRADFASRARAARQIEAGVEVRTVTRLSQTAVVFDRGLALVFGETEDGEPVAWRVHEDNVVRFLGELLDQLWDGAAPFVPGGPGYAEVTDDLQQDIARLMAQGHTDEVVARKLGMSVRTCRRHIAALLRTLDSTSRFQAGARAARRLTIEEG
ncbi:helix-turn-helix transcriptional regulator [Streptomyces uncialis]|uniref:helix-turn-helix transcriptional regulator n=1 Tax=Streptomyces uncialis TaxID=1048205 RepID=UPI00340A4590